MTTLLVFGALVLMYVILVLIGKTNELSKSLSGNPNSYEWITDSFYVDATTESHTIQY